MNSDPPKIVVDACNSLRDLQDIGSLTALEKDNCIRAVSAYIAALDEHEVAWSHEIAERVFCNKFMSLVVSRTLLAHRECTLLIDCQFRRSRLLEAFLDTLLACSRDEIRRVTYTQGGFTTTTTSHSLAARTAVDALWTERLRLFDDIGTARSLVGAILKIFVNIHGTDTFHDAIESGKSVINGIVDRMHAKGLKDVIEPAMFKTVSRAWHDRFMYEKFAHSFTPGFIARNCLVVEALESWRDLDNNRLQWDVSPSVQRIVTTAAHISVADQAIGLAALDLPVLIHTEIAAAIGQVQCVLGLSEQWKLFKTAKHFKVNPQQ